MTKQRASYTMKVRSEKYLCGFGLTFHSDPARVACMCAMLANGSLIIGDMNNAKHLLSQAKYAQHVTLRQFI